MKMQNFGDIRREYDKKKERMRRKIAERGGSNTLPGRMGRSKSNTTMPRSTGKRRQTTRR